jgi:isoquinoline 1-oxidoreductase beta subunit
VKVDGSAKFGIDSRLPGMKFAVVANSPTFGGKLISVDEAKRSQCRASVRWCVSTTPSRSWRLTPGPRDKVSAAAPQDAGPNAKLPRPTSLRSWRPRRKNPVSRQDGDAAAAIASPRKFDAVYEQPFLAHATMEPMNCTMQVTKDLATSGSAHRCRVYKRSGRSPV